MLDEPSIGRENPALGTNIALGPTMGFTKRVNPLIDRITMWLRPAVLRLINDSGCRDMHFSIKKQVRLAWLRSLKLDIRLDDYDMPNC
jgi:hypothetical protein